MRELIAGLFLCGCAAACSGLTTAGDGETADPGPACPAGMPCPGEWFRECFSVNARCVDGQLTGEYGYSCQAYTGRCELGCRQDYSSGSLSVGQGIDYRDVVETGERLCEEYRIEHGARRPGDGCGSDFDCLPFLPGAPPDGTA
ncbi:MAG TPA: hypothetical protein VMG12_44615, partial [Polyangiaceae bacterium]|nr:hypothetical protein [Polyangiaceae bacterium]